MKFEQLISRKCLFPLLVLINIAAILVGIYYYYGQLVSVPLQLLIFVPDCPLYVLLALLIIAKIVKNDAFAFLVSVGMVKYSLWTIFIFLIFSGIYFAPAALPITLLFIAGHLGMLLEGLAVAPKKKVAVAAVLLALGWFLLNDISDYFWGTKPPIPAGNDMLIAAATFAASILFTLLLYFFAEKVRKVPLVEFLRKIMR